MTNMKILNLYACLGGNRYKWNEVKSDIEVTAVELDPEAARLYQEIIFLKHFFNGKWIIENVIPYYEPLIKESINIDRHLYWCNFNLNKFETRKASVCQGTNELNRLCEFHDYDFKKYNGEQSKIKMARNLVDYEVGKTIFETALGIINKSNTTQLQLL